MSKIIFVFLVAVAVCRADSSGVEKPTQGVICGSPPPYINLCLGMPLFFPKEIIESCTFETTVCDSMKCVFKGIGWMDNDKVNKTKIIEHFDQLASRYQEWTAAITHLKAACLGDHDLPAQGVFLNCAPYDIVHCAQTTFLKLASPSQWKGSSRCLTARDFAAACPICPADCFAQQIPVGACNACQTLPRST